jgi:hypothetical protein
MQKTKTAPLFRWWAMRNAWSRVLEMRAELTQLVGDGPDINFNFRGEDVAALHDFPGGSLSAAFRLGSDHSTHLHLNVSSSSKLDAAMDIDHSYQDPRKRAADYFIAPDTRKLVEGEAKTKQGLTWANCWDGALATRLCNCRDKLAIGNGRSR